MKNKLELEQLRAEIVFGNPKLNCAHFGICQILQDQEATPKNIAAHSKPCATSAYGLLSKHEQGLMFQFETKDLSESVLNQYFSRADFLVDCIYRLPSKLCRALGFEQDTYIETGTYNITHNTQSLTILCQTNQSEANETLVLTLQNSYLRAVS